MKNLNKIETIIFDWAGTLYEKNKGLFPYSEKVLKKLNNKNYKLAVITNIKARLKHMDKIGNYFDLIIINVDRTPKQYLECMEILNVKPENTLIVDDRTLRGIKIGNKLGCQTYWIKNREYSNETPNKKTGKPTKTINSIEDLLTIL